MTTVIVVVEPIPITLDGVMLYVRDADAIVGVPEINPVVIEKSSPVKVFKEGEIA